MNRLAVICIVSMVVMASVPGMSADTVDVESNTTTNTLLTGTTIDDFEDGDINVETSGFDGWNQDTSEFSNTNDDKLVINGSRSGKLEGDTNSVHNIDYSPSSGTITPDRVAYKLRIPDECDCSSETWVGLKNSGTKNVRIKFQQNTWDIIANGTTTSAHFEPGTVLDVEVANISYADNEYDLWINGEKVNRFGFNNAASAFDEVNFAVDYRSGASGTPYMVIDDVQHNGTAGIPQPDTSSVSGVVEDFNSGNMITHNSGFEGWYGTTSDFQAQSTDAIEGSHSGEITSSSNKRRAVMGIDGGETLDSISADLKTTSRNMDQNDEIAIKATDNSDTIFRLRLAMSEDERINVNPSGNDENIAFWYHQRTINIRVANISYSSDTFDLQVNGKDAGTYDFTNSAGEIDTIQFRSDSSGGGGTVTGLFDQVSVNGSAQTPDRTFDYSFEDEAADSGVSDSTWNHSGTKTVEEVTTSKASDGSQSYHVEENTGGNARTQYIKQYFENNQTKPVSWKINKPPDDLDSKSPWRTAISVEDHHFRTIGGGGINISGDIVAWNGSSWEEVTSGQSYTDEWVKFTITDIDTQSKTYTLVWDGPSGKGRRENLNWDSSAENGYKNIFLFDQEKGYYDKITDEAVDESKVLKLRVTNYLPHNGTDDYVVKLNETIITDNSSVGSSNATVLSVNETTQTVNATGDKSINKKVKVTATYFDKSTSQNVTVATVEPKNTDILPPLFKLFAILGSAAIQWLALSSIVVMAVGYLFDGLPAVGTGVVLMIFGWTAGWIPLGALLTIVFFSIMIGIIGSPQNEIE